MEGPILDSPMAMDCTADSYQGRQNRIILLDIVAADKSFRTSDDMPEIVERLSDKAKTEVEKQRLYVQLSLGD